MHMINLLVTGAAVIGYAVLQSTKMVTTMHVTILPVDLANGDLNDLAAVSYKLAAAISAKLTVHTHLICIMLPMLCLHSSCPVVREPQGPLLHTGRYSRPYFLPIIGSLTKQPCVDHPSQATSGVLHAVRTYHDRAAAPPLS